MKKDHGDAVDDGDKMLWLASNANVYGAEVGLEALKLKL